MEKTNVVEASQWKVIAQGKRALNGKRQSVTMKPIEYYVKRNAIFECVAVVGWWLVAFLILGMILSSL